MPDPLHPAAPVVSVAPAEPVSRPAPSFGDLLTLLDGPIPRRLPAVPLPIDLVEPDAPAPVGDRVPCHLFWAPLAEPLPPVLRPDAPEPVFMACSDGLGWTPFDQARLAAWLAAPTKRPSWHTRARWFLADYSEWLTAGVILFLFAAVALAARR